MEKTTKRKMPGGAPLYGFGLLGALVYFLQHASGFWSVLFAFVKAIVWPALLVYRLFEFLNR